MKAATKHDRHKLLGSLFIEAVKKGISQEDLRNTIAPEFLGKRLSQANVTEINKLRNHITGYKPTWKKYPPSLTGLKEEICDIAKARWGEGWEGSLNAFCKKFGIQKWQWLNISHAKAIKQRLKVLQGQPPRPEDRDTPPCQGGE